MLRINDKGLTGQVNEDVRIGQVRMNIETEAIILVIGTPFNSDNIKDDYYYSVLTLQGASEFRLRLEGRSKTLPFNVNKERIIKNYPFVLDAELVLGK